MRPVVNEGREIEPQNINTKDLFEVKREEVEKEFLRSIERTKKIPDEPVFTGFMNLLDIVQSDNHIKERHLSRLQIVKEAKEYTLGYKSINDDGQIKATDNTTSEEPGLAKQREKLNSQIDLLKSKLDEVDLRMISEDYIGSQLENKMEEFTRDINLRTQEYNEMKNDTRRMAGEVNKVGLYGTEYMKAEKKWRQYIDNIIRGAGETDDNQKNKESDLNKKLDAIKSLNQEMLTSSTQNRYDMHMLAIERGRQFKRLRKIKKTLNKVQKRIKDIPDHSIKVEELLFSYHQLVDKKLFPPNCKPVAYKTILEFGFEDEERKQEIKENLFFESTQEIIMAYRSFEETFLTREKETEKLNKLVGEKREEYVKGEYECEVLRKTFGEEEKRLNPLQLTNYTGLIDSQLYDKIPVDRGGKSINVLTGYYEFNDERENLENWLNGVDKHLQNIMQKFTYMVKRFKMIGIQIMKFDKILREDFKYFKMLNLQYSSKKLNYKNFSRFDMKRISQPLFSTSEASVADTSQKGSISYPDGGLSTNPSKNDNDIMNDNADEYSFLGEESVNANKIEKNKWLQEPVSIDAIENLKNHLSHDNYILFKQMFSNNLFLRAFALNGHLKMTRETIRDGSNPDIVIDLLKDLKRRSQHEYCMRVIELTNEISEIFKLIEKDIYLLGGGEKKKSFQKFDNLKRDLASKSNYFIKPYREAIDSLFELQKNKPLDRTKMVDEAKFDHTNFNQFRQRHRNELLGIEDEVVEIDPKHKKRKYDCKNFTYSVNNFHKGIKEIRSHTISTGNINSKASTLSQQIDSILTYTKSKSFRIKGMTNSIDKNKKEKVFKLPPSQTKSLYQSTAELDPKIKMTKVRKSVGEFEKTYEHSISQNLKLQNKQLIGSSTKERSYVSDRELKSSFWYQ